MAKREILVFDIGGTNVRGAVYDPASGRLARSLCRPTQNFLTQPGSTAEALFEGTLEEAAAVGRALTDGVAPAAVVLGWPGPIGPDGTALRSPTILGPLDRPIPVRAYTAQLWPGSELFVLNDLTCAGYAYAALGNGDFCIVTVGSGIGNKVFVDGKPVVGPGGRGGEIGHIAVHRPEGCPEEAIPRGARLGEISSGRGTLAVARRLASARPETFARSPLAVAGPQTESRELVAAFLAGDPFAREAVAIAAAPLAHALAFVHVSVGTECFIITGGFATALGECYRRLLVTGACSSAWDIGQDWEAMIELGDERDGLLGAGAFAARALPGSKALAA
jgi:glucokinase